MKSLRAAALRLILPLDARGSTVDFLETGTGVDFVEAGFDLEEVLLVDRDEDDDRVEDERDEEAWPPFCAPNVTGNSSARATRASLMPLNISSLSVIETCICDYQSHRG